MENPLLEFHTRVNTRTSEISPTEIAYYRGMKFTIFNTLSDNSRITFEGSLHKYWNKGEHNFNDFNLQAICWVFSDLKDKFNIRPSDCSIKQLEVGINFQPPYPTNKILQSCLFHKTNIFKWVYVADEGNYIQAYHSNYIIKIYDKQKHYQLRGFKIPKPIMRFEIKLRREKLNNIIAKKGETTFTDVINYGFKNFERILILEWQKILFYDFEIFDNTKFEHQYSNPNYWLSLKKENFKYHRRMINKKLESAPQNLKYRISEVIREKVLQLVEPVENFIFEP